MQESIKMDTKLKAVPNLHPSLLPYIRNVVSRFEGIDIEADEAATHEFVLLLPCADVAVRCLFNLQDIKMLDIGFYDRPEFSDYIMNCHFENIVNSWDHDNPEALVIVVQRLKKVLVEFSTAKLPANICTEILGALPSEETETEVLYSELNPNQMNCQIRIFSDKSKIRALTGEEGPEWVRSRRFYIDCTFQLDVPTQIPKKIEFKTSHELAKVAKNVSPKRRLDNIPKLLSFLKDTLKLALTIATTRELFFRKQRRHFMAILGVVFGKHVIRMDRVDFVEATIIVGHSPSFLLDLKLEQSQVQMSSGNGVTEIQEIKIIAHSLIDPSEAMDAFRVKLTKDLLSVKKIVQLFWHEIVPRLQQKISQS
jgi:hypothetical protein